MLSAGFIGNAIWSYTYRQPLILAFWPQPINLPVRRCGRLFHINDSSLFYTSLLSLSIHSCSSGFGVRFAVTVFSSHRRPGPLYGGPTYRLRTSRYRRDDPVTPASGERDSHRTGGPVKPILAKLSNVNKHQRTFLTELFSALLGRQGRATFENLARYSPFTELTFRRHFATCFDWLAFNKACIDFTQGPFIGIVDCSRVGGPIPA